MAKRKDKGPEEISLPKVKNVYARLMLVLRLLVAGAWLITSGVISYFSKDAGWTRVETKKPLEYSDDFLFYYELSSEASAEYRQLTEIYTRELTRRHRMFDPSDRRADVKGLGSLNASPNEEVVLEKEVWRALELFERYGSRDLFLAPVYRMYSQVYLCSEDYETDGLDPARSEERLERMRELLDFIDDPGSVSIELLDGSRARLRVSEEYLEYASRHGIDTFVDLFWYTDAFVIDSMADALARQGLTKGYILSRDYFLRCLDSRDIPYSIYIYDCEGSVIRDVADLEYTGPVSAASLRSFAMEEGIADMYYEYTDGTVTGPFISASDGLPKAPVTALTVLGTGKSCGECALQAARVYVADKPDISRLGDGFSCAWVDGRVIYHLGDGLKVSSPFSKDGIEYTVRQAGPEDPAIAA